MKNYDKKISQSIFKRIIFSLIPLIIVLSTLEGAARLLPPIKAPGGGEAAFMGGSAGMFRDDPLLKWRVISDAVSGMTLNSGGFRGKEFPNVAKKDGETRILALGDSTTWGMGVQDEYVWTARLEEILQKRRIFKNPSIMNAAVPGYTSFQGKLLFETELKKYDPDIIITYFGVNDASSRPGMIKDSQWKLPPVKLVPVLRVLRKSMLYRDLKALTASLKGKGGPVSVAPSKNAYIQRVTPEEYEKNLERIETLAGENTKFIHIAPAWYLAGKVRSDVAIIVFTGTGTVSVFTNDGKSVYEREPMLRLVDVFKTYDTKPEEIFSDYCHLKPAGHEIVAREIAAILSELPGQTR